MLYCLVQLDVVLLYLYLLLVGLWHQNMLSLMVTQAAYQMLYHFDKSKTHICYISLIKGAVYSLFLTRCPPIGFTSIKHKGLCHIVLCIRWRIISNCLGTYIWKTDPHGRWWNSADTSNYRKEAPIFNSWSIIVSLGRTK